MFPKINSLKPYFKLERGNKGLHDYFMFQIAWFNKINFRLTLFGFGFTAGIVLYDVYKEIDGD